MPRFKFGPQTVISAVLALLLFTSVAWQSALAQGAPHPASAPPSQPAAVLSPSLSYYFISGNTFTPANSVDFAHQPFGCVQGMPLGSTFSAPVHLPQASAVVSMTLFTVDAVLTATTSAATLYANDGQGGYTATVLAAFSIPQLTGYQHNDSTIFSNLIVNNQNLAYQVDWEKTGSDDSPSLGLCGVRLAYHAPAAGMYLPTVEK